MRVKLTLRLNLTVYLLVKAVKMVIVTLESLGIDALFAASLTWNLKVL